MHLYQSNLTWSLYTNSKMQIKSSNLDIFMADQLNCRMKAGVSQTKGTDWSVYAWCLNVFDRMTSNYDRRGSVLATDKRTSSFAAKNQSNDSSVARTLLDGVLQINFEQLFKVHVTSVIERPHIFRHYEKILLFLSQNFRPCETKL